MSRYRNTPSLGTTKNLHRKCHKQTSHAVYLFRYAQHERYAYNSSVFLYANLAVSTKGGKVITPNWGPSPKRLQNYEIFFKINCYLYCHCIILAIIVYYVWYMGQKGCLILTIRAILNDFLEILRQKRFLFLQVN